MPTDRKRKSGRPRGNGQKCVETGGVASSTHPWPSPKLLFFFFYLLVKTAPVSLATCQSTGERRSGLELRLQSTSPFTRCHPHTPNSIISSSDHPGQTSAKIANALPQPCCSERGIDKLLGHLEARFRGYALSSDRVEARLSVSLHRILVARRVV